MPFMKQSFHFQVKKIKCDEYKKQKYYAQNQDGVGVTAGINSASDLTPEKFQSN